MEGRGSDRRGEGKSKFSINSKCGCLPQVVVNKYILRTEYVLMLTFIRLVRSEMPFLATNKMVPVQVEGVSLFVAELCGRAGDGDG